MLLGVGGGLEAEFDVVLTGQIKPSVQGRSVRADAPAGIEIGKGEKSLPVLRVL